MGRFKRVRVLLALAVVATGLVVVNSGASALPTNNYTGPRDCADVETEYGGLDFECSPAAANASQSSDGGVNLYEATGNGGTVTQTNTTGPNIAVCVVDTGTIPDATANTTQACNFTQDTDPGTGDNTIIADIRATHTFNQSGIQTQSSTVSQSLIGSQTSTSGTNTVRGPAAGAAALLQTTQSQTSSINASVPPSQAQERRLLVDVDQFASTSGNNWVSFNLDSSQTMDTESVLAGTQDQDVFDSNGAGTDDPNARALVYQRTGSGNNYTKGRGTDAKTERAQSTFAGETQNQWHTGGGFDIVADVDDVSGTGTIDFGTPYAEGTDCTAVDGFRKLGVIETYSGVPDGNPATKGPAAASGSASQDDKLPITIPGTSPDDSTVAACSKLTGPSWTVQTADVSVDGHADNAIVGAIAASLISGGTTAAYVPFNDQTVHVNLLCTRNAPNTCGTSGGGVTGSGTDVSAVEDVQFEAQVASFTNDNPDNPVESAEIIWGDDPGADPTTVTVDDTSGTVTGTHTYDDPGTYTIDTTLLYGDGSVAATMSSTATVADAIEYAFPNGGSFVISDAAGGGNVDVGDVVTFWWDAWNTVNPFKSGKVAPSQFKGWENTLNNPTCGDPNAAAPSFASVGGNSAPPPADTLPQYMGVIIASEVKNVKNTPTGKVWGIAIVETTGTGYGPNPQSRGQGTVVGIACTRG